MSRLPRSVTGKVYLVGAGPGDPGLITLRGVRCLSQADLVVHDCLVDPQLLRFAPPNVEVVCLGHHSGKRGVPQAEISQRLVEEARKGRIVVRLKGGDPDVFGRGADDYAVNVIQRHFARFQRFASSFPGQLFGCLLCAPDKTGHPRSNDGYSTHAVLPFIRKTLNVNCSRSQQRQPW